MNTKQNLFTEEELAKVTDEAERKHLIECAQDQSKIDMKYMEIMSKYDLWEKGKRSRYFHATTHENAKKIMQDGVIRKGIDGGVYICKHKFHCCLFVFNCQLIISAVSRHVRPRFLRLHPPRCPPCFRLVPPSGSRCDRNRPCLRLG